MFYGQPSGRTLAEVLLDDGYDVWAQNWRGSLDFPPNLYTLDRVARVRPSRRGGDRAGGVAGLDAEGDRPLPGIRQLHDGRRRGAGARGHARRLQRRVAARTGDDEDADEAAAHAPARLRPHALRRRAVGHSAARARGPGPGRRRAPGSPRVRQPGLRHGQLHVRHRARRALAPRQRRPRRPRLDGARAGLRALPGAPAPAREEHGEAAHRPGREAARDARQLRRTGLRGPTRASRSWSATRTGCSCPPARGRASSTSTRTRPAATRSTPSRGWVTSTRSSAGTRRNGRSRCMLAGLED